MVDNVAPVGGETPRSSSTSDSKPQENTNMLDPQNPSAVSVTVVGCGGCGTNLARPFLTNLLLANVLYFDTSAVNVRPGERSHILGSGSGSGSNRAENARDIERTIPALSDSQIGLGDVAVVIFSLAGGSGSVLGPLLVREYARRGTRVIVVVVADSSSARGAENTLNTLKTLTQICKNGDVYLPIIFLSNDQANRSSVDETATIMINDLIDLLTTPVLEVDRNDRMNWINPTKTISTQPGLKLISFAAGSKIPDTKAVLGLDSKEMVDSLLIIQNVSDETVEQKNALPPSRLKKTGFYPQEGQGRRIVGCITSDVSPIEDVINRVERTQNQDKSQKHSTIDRLSSAVNDDLII